MSLDSCSVEAWNGLGAVGDAAFEPAWCHYIRTDRKSVV